MNLHNFSRGILATSLLLATIHPISPLETSQSEDFSLVQTKSTVTSESDFFFEDGTIKQYLGKGGHVVVPSTINGELVRSTYGIKNSDTITSITLPNTVSHTGTFEGCKNLTSIYIPDDLPLTGITMNMFSGVDNVTIYGASSAIPEDYTAPAETIAKFNGVNFVSTGTIHQVPEGFPLFGLEETWQTAYNTYSPWAQSHFDQAYENGFVLQSLGVFYVNDIYRFQIADLFIEMIEKRTETLPLSEDLFTDTSLSSVRKANTIGVISGMPDGRFGVNETATREQIAVMLLKSIEYLEETTGNYIIDKNTTLQGYVDFDSVSDWAQDAVAIIVNNGLMTGYTERTFAPHENTTIEQCFVMINKLWSLYQ